MEILEHLIVGAGPAALFMASELNRLGENRFLILDRGTDLSEREYTLRNFPHSIARQAIVYGLGGAGLFSDGKFNFSPRIGGSAHAVLTPEMHEALTAYAIDRFGFGVVPPNSDAACVLEKGWFTGRDGEVVMAPQVHIGSDHLPDFVRELTRDFADRILLRQDVQSVDRCGELFVVRTADREYAARRLVIAVGQAGYALAETVAREFGLAVQHSPADLGIRVEMPHGLWEPVVEVQWDTKIYWYTSAGAVRTFCTNPRGFVVAEYKKGFLSVNGHAKRDVHSDYTNTALMLKVDHEQPNEFLVGLCTEISRATGNRPLVQRADDFLEGRATTALTIEPTCPGYTLGELAPFYPPVARTAFHEVLEALAETIPGFLSGGSIVYAPEVKLYSTRIRVARNSFESEVPGLFFVGDACGHIHGLANAMLSGLSCGRYCAGAVPAAPVA